MKLSSVILIVFACCLLVSCGIHVAVPVSYAPKINLSDSAATVLIINRFDPNQLQYKREKKTNAIKNGSLALCQSVENELKVFPGVKVISVYDSIMMATDIHGMLDSNILLTEQIDQLAAKYHPDYILSLENYEAGFRQDRVESVKDDKGLVSKTAYYSIYANSTWVWYNIAANKFVELKGIASAYHSSRPVISGLFSFGPAISPNADEIKAVSSKAANALSSHFKPHEELLSRKIYSKKLLKESALAIRNGLYEQAEKLLEPLTRSADDDTASKALYNRAVIFEVYRNTQSAKDFAELSMKKKNNSLAQKLLESYH